MSASTVTTLLQLEAENRVLVLVATFFSCGSKVLGGEDGSVEVGIGQFTTFGPSDL